MTINYRESFAIGAQAAMTNGYRRVAIIDGLMPFISPLAL
jgi:hypothetical protein